MELSWCVSCRKVTSLQRMVSQNHHFQMGGKGKMDFTRSDSPEEGSWVRPPMPLRLQKKSVRFGIKKSSKKIMLWEWPATEEANLSF